MNKLFKLRIDKMISLRTLSFQTNINVVSLSDFQRNKKLPNEIELQKLNNVFDNQLSMDDFYIDNEVIKTDNAFSEAYKLIYAQRDKKRNGFVKCPLCGKKLHYSFSDYNNHCMAKCETENCLCWIQ